MATFDQQTILSVWNKGQIVPGVSPSLKRKDVCGAWISWNQYGNRDNDYNEGWEIDHITPESKDGSNQLSNLRPLHWKNNVRKSDGSLVCAVSAK
jgi:5-methylcytosine-specific restriction endonuclease McrA